MSGQYAREPDLHREGTDTRAYITGVRFDGAGGEGVQRLRKLELQRRIGASEFAHQVFREGCAACIEVLIDAGADPDLERGSALEDLGEYHGAAFVLGGQRPDIDRRVGQQVESGADRRGFDGRQIPLDIDHHGIVWNIELLGGIQDFLQLFGPDQLHVDVWYTMVGL